MNGVSCCTVMGNFFHSQKVGYFGFHAQILNSSQDSLEALNNDDEWGVVKWNALVAVNLIPLFGSFLSGIFMLIKGIIEEDKFLIGRGIAQIFLGPIIAILDIIATLGRLLTPRPSQI